MEKWADFLISAVRYQTTAYGRHISHLLVHQDNGTTVGSGTIKTKNEVVVSISSGKKYITIYKDSNNQWKKGEDVRVVFINGQSYLRTDANQISGDNLGNLPEF